MIPVMQPIFGDQEFGVGIEHDQVCVVSSSNSAFTGMAASETGGTFGHPTCDIRQRESPFAGFGPHDWQR